MVAEVFGRRPFVWRYERVHTVIVKLRGKAIEKFLRRFLTWEHRRTHTIRLNRFAMRQGRSFLRGIIRGLVAGDGSIAVAQKRIAFGVTSRLLAKQFALILRKFEIECRSYTTSQEGKMPMHNVTIGSQEAIKKFKLRIGLTDPAKRKQLDQIARR